MRQTPISLAKNWWPTAIVLLIVLWLTLAPHPLPENNIELFPGADKLAHALMMGGLTAVLIFDYYRSRKKPRPKVGLKEVIVITIGMLLFSALDELAQDAMRQGRTADILDFAADTVGIIIICITEPPLLNKFIR